MRMALNRGVGLWLPPLALMALIFFFSAQPDLSSGLGTCDLVLRKIVHFTEYGAALLPAVARRSAPHMDGRRAALVALAIASAYAVTDEWHQTFVEGRHGTPVDWLIDTAGAGARGHATACAREQRRQVGLLMPRRLPIESVPPVVVFACRAAGALAAAGLARGGWSPGTRAGRTPRS